ncbi:uncharacterized protein LOC143022812 [Oratosquilla oratoria]|uniref:uncharacterized protein LOC143022812 n=1 Tax=Oratosquilla oratoria TaxID=337810 RepID=UPI003F75D163
MSVVVLQAPVMVARALSRRAVHWIVMRHQQHKLRLSLRRRRRRSSLLWRSRQDLLVQVLQHRSHGRKPGGHHERRLLPARSPSKVGKNKPLRFRPPMRVPSQKALTKSRHITYRKMPPTHDEAVPKARPEEGTTDDGLYEEIPVPLYRNLHTSLGHVHHPAATRSLHRTPGRPRVPQGPPPTLRGRSGTTTIPTTHSFSNPLSSTCGRSVTLGNAFVNEDRWRTFPRSSRPAAVYQNLNFSAGEVDTADTKSCCRGASPFSIEEWLEWWLEEERKVYSSGGKKRMNYSHVVERPATSFSSSSSSSSETSSSDKTSDSGVDVDDGSLGPRNSELRLTKSKSDNRISKLIQHFEKNEDDCELDVRLKALPEVIQRGTTTPPHPGPKDSPPRATRRPLPPKPSAILQPSRSWSAFEDDRLDGLLVSSRLSLPEGHFDGPVQAINPMYISQATLPHPLRT